MRSPTRRSRLVLFAAIAALAAVPAAAQRVSLVWDGVYDDEDGSVSTETYARRHALESLGFPVRLENPNNSESWYNTYGANSLYDVIYVSGESGVALLANKLRGHQTAVIYETPEMDAAFGLSDSNGTAADGTQIQIDTLAHPVTATSFLGNANLYTAANPISVLQGTPAASLQVLASQGGQTCLAVVEAGGTLANTIDGNATAPKRLVRLPFGAHETNWSEVTGTTLELVEQAVLWASEPDYTPSGALGVCVMVTADNGVLNTEETWRVRRLAYYGWAVILLWDGDSQANYDTAVAAADVVYVTTEADASDVGDKLRTAACGVVYENNELDDNLGLATGSGIRTVSTGFYTRDREHPVTANMYLDEYVSCFYRFDYAAGNHPGENQELGRMSGTLAPDLRVLGTRWSEPVLAAIDTGEQLANTIGGNDTAAGRRVRLPWVGAADLTTMPSWAEGSQVWYQALRWAAGTQTGTLIAHYKLDEASGTTAADSSGNGYDGEYRGGVTQNITPAPRSIAANFDAVGEYVFAPSNSDFANLAADNGDFSVAFWIRPHEVTHAEWRNLFHIGGATSSDRGPLIMLHPTLRRFYCWVSTTSIPTGTGGYSSFEVDNDEWVHVTVVKSGSYMRWYLNGEFVNTHAVNGESVATQGDLRIGEESWWGRPDADLDDFRVYSYAISDQEIAELHADLVLHYKFDETSGTVAEDSSIFGADGAINGSPTWESDGSIGGALAVDYTNGEDYVEAPSNTTLDKVNEDNFTVMAWVKPGSVPSGSGSANDAQYGILIKEGNHVGINYTNAQQFQMDLLVGGSTWVGAGTYSDSYAPGGWHHVAGVVDYLAGTVQIYIDGVLRGTDNFTPGSAPTDYGSVPWRVGIAAPGASSWGWAADASIDDVRIYNRALSDTEIFELGGSGLRLHLKLDETSGTVAEDSSPYGNDGAHEGGVSYEEEGMIGVAATLDGTDGAIRVADDGALNFADQITVSAWIRPDSLTSWRRLASKGTGDGYQLRIATGGYIDFQCYLQGGGAPNVTSTRPVSEDLWSHVAATYDGITLRLYLDGELDAEVASPGLIAASTSDFLVGVTPSGLGAFDGSIDEIRVYSQALSAEDIAELHGLIGHWRLDEVAGATTAVDETVFAQDGIYHATPTLEEESPYPSDVVRTAARFEPGQYVQVPAAEHLEVGTDNADFSVAYWLRNNRESSVQWREVVKKHASGRERTFAMWLSPYDERLYSRISTDHSWNEGATYTNASFDIGVWRHVAYVKRGSQLRIYVDGVLDQSANLNGAVFSNNGSLHFGVRGTSWRSDVSIDDFRLYSRALNDWEVAELHGLVGQWKLDEVSGAVATDSSGMKRDGTYVGSPALGTELGPADGSLAVDFDGIDDLVQLPTFRDNFTTGFGLSGWARPTANGNFERIINLSEATGDYVGLGRRATSNTLYGIGHTAAWTDNALHQDVWRHYAVSVDDTGMMTFYRNGVQLAAPQSVTLPSDSPRTTNSIGGTVTGGSEDPFTGQLYDVRVYNRPISRAEARALYYGEGVPGLRIVRWVEVANP